MIISTARIDAAGRSVRLDPTDPAFYSDPYATFADIRAATSVFFWEEIGMWCLLDYEAVNAVFRDRRFGREILHVATRAELGWPEPAAHLEPFYAMDNLSMLAREPPAHTRLRSLVNRAFVSRQIERLRPRVATLANSLIDRFADRGETDLIAAFATPIPVIVIAELLGVPTSAAPSLLDWSHKMVAMYRPRRDRDIEDAAVAATLEFAAFLRDVVAARRASPRDDLISHLIATEAAGDRLSEDELIAGCMQLLNAGHEATVHAIGNAARLVLESDQDRHNLFSTETATVATVEEALRLDPPLHFFDRYALEPVDVAGVKLGKGEKIGLLLAAANRDPIRWNEPDRFDPGRALQPNLAFGAGIHFCLGAPLARLEMQVALPILFSRLPGLRLDGEPRMRNSWHFHGVEQLRVRW